ncbi:MAG: zinc ribbon domain-containing protein [Gemmatimonadaceae bacterium]
MDPLDRLSQELVRAAQQTGALHRPIAIREIVTTLVPYRVVRPLRIAELLDDYRQLVLRLIAGERELVEADAEVRAAARAALASRHPDLSVLERYGDHLVTVASAASASPAASPTPVTPATPATNEMTVASGTSADSVASDAPAACRYCTRALPAGYTHRFCPWCGHHLLRRCQSCRASLEATWTFCVTCGHPA